MGVTGYRVERCQGAGCTTFAQIATPTGTSFSDTGLTAGTSYSYRVRAMDAAGNLERRTRTSRAPRRLAPDTQPPTAPARLTATAVGAAPDQSELDGLDRQRRRYRLPGRALPGRGLHRPSRRSRRRRHHLQRHGPDRRTRVTAIAYARSMRPRNAGAYSPIASATTPLPRAGSLRRTVSTREPGRRPPTPQATRSPAPDRHDVDDRRQVRERPRLQRDDHFVNLGNPTPLKITGR